MVYVLVQVKEKTDALAQAVRQRGEFPLPLPFSLLRPLDWMMSTHTTEGTLPVQMLIQKPDTPRNNVQPDIPALCNPIKLTRKIQHHTLLPPLGRACSSPLQHIPFKPSSLKLDSFFQLFLETTCDNEDRHSLPHIIHLVSPGSVVVWIKPESAQEPCCPL